MPLKAVMDTLEGVSEDIANLYTKKGDVYELTGIVGIKTQGDIDRLNESLRKEKEDHSATKEKYRPWAEMDHAETMASLDKIPELKAAAEGKLDEAAIEAIVNKRVEGTINSRLAPIERQNKELATVNENLTLENSDLKSEKTQRSIHDHVRKAMVESKVIPEAHEDALFLAERIFEVREDDGAIVTRDNVGVTPGVQADVWLTEIQEKRPHWWPDSVGGGAGGGSKNSGGTLTGANNPFSHEGWNLTKQGELLRTKSRDQVERIAQAAGTTIGGKRPAKKAA